tara:strand:+ start:13000 stop:13947 length:948 start_codon:yes stop_codon:yes gene_type:complete
MSFLNFFFFILFSYLSGNLYKYVWNKYHLLKTIPTGFGFIIMIQALFLFLLNFGDVDNINLYLIYLIFFLSFVYWFDDLIGLSALLRLFIQFFLGFGISYIFLEPLGTFENYLYLTTIFFGFSGIVLCNVINFYDGLDLNITILILINLLIIFFFSTELGLKHFTLILIALMIGFALINVFPKSIYFGDSGCFIFASYLLFSIFYNLLIENFQILIVLAGLSLPIFDFIFVNVLRLYLKENLLSRNYYYLYQKFNSKFRNYFYLALQPLNTILIIFLNFILMNSGIAFLTSITFSCILVTLCFYVICRFYILKNE